MIETKIRITSLNYAGVKKNRVIREMSENTEYFLHETWLLPDELNLLDCQQGIRFLLYVIG